MPGAIVTTLAIVLPGYIMIPLLHGYEHLRDSRWIRGLHEGSEGYIRGTDSGGSRPDLPRRTDSAHRMGRTARDAGDHTTAQVEHARGIAGGKLSGAAAQMVPINRD